MIPALSGAGKTVVARATDTTGGADRWHPEAGAGVPKSAGRGIIGAGRRTGRDETALHRAAHMGAAAIIRDGRSGEGVTPPRSFFVRGWAASGGGAGFELAEPLHSISMSEESVSRADQGLFAAYGRTMLSVQLFEMALLGLVQINQPELAEDTSFEDGWKQVEPLFRMTAGQLRRELQKQGSVPDALLEEIQTAVNTRNTLAHGYLLEYRISVFSGAATPREAVKGMKAVRGLYQDLNVRLRALTRQRAEGQG